MAMTQRWCTTGGGLRDSPNPHYGWVLANFQGAHLGREHWLRQGHWRWRGHYGDVLQAEAFETPPPPTTGGFSRISGEHVSPEVNNDKMFSVNDPVDMPIYAVGDDSDSDDGNNGVFMITTAEPFTKARRRESATSRSSSSRPSSTGSWTPPISLYLIWECARGT